MFDKALSPSTVHCLNNHAPNGAIIVLPKNTAIIQTLPQLGGREVLLRGRGAIMGHSVREQPSRTVGVVLQEEQGGGKCRQGRGEVKTNMPRECFRLLSFSRKIAVSNAQFEC